MTAPSALPTVMRMRAIGTTAEVAVTDAALAPRAARMLRDELAAVDATCSRFRDDSEIAGVERACGTHVAVSALLFEALQVACDVADRTDGAVDPTVGAAMRAIGYDRDFDDIGALGPHDSAVRDSAATPVPAPGWGSIELDTRRRTVRLAPGVHVDLGASAKALVADRAAARIAGALGTGVLVGVGGDVAVAGPAPDDGWAVGIAPDSAAAPDQVHQVVGIDRGAVATSSTAVRVWSVGGLPRHHIVDPATGTCAAAHWSLVSAFAASCVEANAASTAAVVWGSDAPRRLVALGHPARLVDRHGRVLTLNGWPADDGDTSPVRTEAAS